MIKVLSIRPFFLSVLLLCATQAFAQVQLSYDDPDTFPINYVINTINANAADLQGALLQDADKTIEINPSTVSGNELKDFFALNSLELLDYFNQYVEMRFKTWDGYFLYDIYLPENVAQGRRFMMTRDSSWAVRIHLNNTIVSPAHRETVVFEFMNNAWVQVSRTDVNDLLSDALNTITKTAADSSLSTFARTDAYQQLVNLIAAYPQYFANVTLNRDITSRLISLRANLRGALYTLKCINIDSPAFSQECWNTVANDLGYSGYAKQILADFGVLLEDNNESSEDQKQVIHRYLSTLDRQTWQIGLLTLRSLLNSSTDQFQAMNSFARIFGANNTFSTALGVVEYSSPLPDYFGFNTSTGVSQFLIALAHEINHNSLDSSRTVMYRTFGGYYRQRLTALLSKVAGPLVAFGPTLQRAQTQQNFLQAGLWDGNVLTWSTAWQAYWDARRDHYPRRPAKFFIENPQEAFATLANLFNTDSYRFLQMAQLDYQNGKSNSIDAFLLFVDYHSRLTGTVAFTQADRLGNITPKNVAVIRNEQQFVTGLDFGAGVTVSFSVDELGWVNRDFEVPSYEQMVAVVSEKQPSVLINDVVLFQSQLKDALSAESLATLFADYEKVQYNAINGFWTRHVYLPNGVEEGQQFIFERSSSWRVTIHYNDQTLTPERGTTHVFEFVNGQWRTVLEAGLDLNAVISTQQSLSEGLSQFNNRLVEDFARYETVSLHLYNGFWVRNVYLPERVSDGQTFTLRRSSSWWVNVHYNGQVYRAKRNSTTTFRYENERWSIAQ